MKYKKHIFICTNQKDNGKKCCGQEDGMKLVLAMQSKMKEKDLHLEMRAQRAGCLNVCANGPAMVIYPEGVFYAQIKSKDVKSICDEHLYNCLGKRIKRSNRL